MQESMIYTIWRWCRGVDWLTPYCRKTEKISLHSSAITTAVADAGSGCFFPSTSCLGLKEYRMKSAWAEFCTTTVTRMARRIISGDMDVNLLPNQAAILRYGNSASSIKHA